MRQLQDVGRVVRLAAELARQRPFRARAVAVDAADDAGAGGRAGDLLDLGLAVDRVKRHSQRKGGRDLALLLDRIAVGDALGQRAGGERRLRLGNRGDVETGAELGQELEDVGRRIGLDRVEHLAVGQRPGKRQVVLAHHVEIDHQAGAVVLAVLQEFTDACGHRDLAPYPATAACRLVNLLQCPQPPRDAVRVALRRLLPWSGLGGPVPHARQDGQAFSVIRHWRRQCQKSPLRRCFKPRSPLRTGCAGFASGCRSHGRRVHEQGREIASLGGCPASCPDAHRPTHGHRHVRNWAFLK